MMFRIGQAGEQAPPIVAQRPHAGEQPAPRQILRREAAPAPLVLQFVEPVFAVGPIAIQLAERQDLAVQRSDQSGILPNALVRPDLGKAEPPLGGVGRMAIATSRASLRRSRMIRRWRLQPASRRLVSLPCQPWPASPQSACCMARSSDRLTLAVMRKRNRYARSLCSARAITRSMPHDLSPRSSAGRRVGPR